MASLPPEVWHIVASFLSIHDATQLRLVSKYFADIAGAHIIPHVSFQMHQDDIARLGGISSHDVLAPNVRSLTYYTTLYKTPAWTFDEYKEANKCTSSGVKLADGSTLLSEHKKYQHMVAVQDQMIVDMADLSCLKDAIAKLTGLRHVTMSSWRVFNRQFPSTQPFNTHWKMLEWPEPEGVRKLEVLLEALIHNKVKLDSLRADTLTWEFFDKTTTELVRLFQPTVDAAQVELEITLEEGGDEWYGDSEKCRQLMERGMLREILSRMKRLKSLRVGFPGIWNLHEHRPAMLKDIMSSRHHWPQLQRLELSSVEADRHVLMRLLRLHRDTLRFLCLQNVHLGETSWAKLLPEIRNGLYLEDARIHGLISGRTEGMPDEGLLESWDLYVPLYDDLINDMGNSINCYCRKGGENYPDELPLTDEIVRKNFNEYILPIWESNDIDPDDLKDFFARVEDLSEGDGSDGSAVL